MRGSDGRVRASFEAAPYVGHRARPALAACAAGPVPPGSDEGAVLEQLADAREVAGVDALAVRAEQVADVVSGRHGCRVY